MKDLYESLDYVLQTLIDNDGIIYHYGWKEEDEIIETDSYKKLAESIDLKGWEFVQFLEILKDKKYIVFHLLGEQPPEDGIALLNINTGKAKTIRNKSSFARDNAYKVNYIVLRLTGKFFHEQGGFQGEETASNQEKIQAGKDRERIVRHDAQIKWLTYVIAFGTAVAAAYYIWYVWTFYHPVSVREYSPSN